MTRNVFRVSPTEEVRRRAIAARAILDGVPKPAAPTPVLSDVTFVEGPFKRYVRRVVAAHGMTLAQFKEKIRDRKQVYVAVKAELAWAGVYRFNLSTSLVARLMGLYDHTSVIYLRRLVDRVLMTAYGVSGRDALSLHRRDVRVAFTAYQMAVNRRISVQCKIRGAAGVRAAVAANLARAARRAG